MKDFIIQLFPMFVATDPFALVPTFLMLTQGMSVRKRRSIVTQTFAAAVILGILFAIAGLGLFHLVGMTIADFRIGGGLVFLIVSIRTILGLESVRQAKPDAAAGIVPLTTPGIVGPAVISNIVLLSQRFSVPFAIAVFLVNLIFAVVLLWYASETEKIVGRGGIQAISKVIAMLLVGIAVSYIRKGIVQTIHEAFVATP